MPAITPMLTPACTFRYVTEGSLHSLTVFALTGTAGGVLVLLTRLPPVLFGVVLEVV